MALDGSGGSGFSCGASLLAVGGFRLILFCEFADLLAFFLRIRTFIICYFYMPFGTRIIQPFTITPRLQGDPYLRMISQKPGLQRFPVLPSHVVYSGALVENTKVCAVTLPHHGGQPPWLRLAFLNYWKNNNNRLRNW
ncbi:hypothetical protein [Enterobacter ludwigii]|uniref:hypothetical protein n=1 Tax=Enterobacter ludwigii TaxID=299767 RepID=UPI0020747D10|nr:hypothetical protein [Enterobacter ludwigii]